MILGPNTVTGHYSSVYTAECSINYSLRMARAVFSGHASYIEVLPRAQRRYNTWIREQLGKCIWTKENGGNSHFSPDPVLTKLLFFHIFSNDAAFGGSGCELD